MIKKLFLSLLIFSLFLFGRYSSVSAQQADHCSLEVRNANGQVIVPQSKNYTVTIDTEALASVGNKIYLTYYIDNDFVLENQWAVAFVPDTAGLDRKEGLSYSNQGRDNPFGYTRFDVEIPLNNARSGQNQSFAFLNWNGSKLAGNVQEPYCPQTTLIIDDLESCQITSIFTDTAFIQATINGTELSNGEYILQIDNGASVIGTDNFNGNQVWEATVNVSLNQATPLRFNVYKTNVSGTASGASICNATTIYDPNNLGLDNNPENVREYNLCAQIPSGASEALISCTTCQRSGGVWTSVGCIGKNTSSFFGSLFSIGLGISGGIATLMILLSGFEFTISQGDPKRTSEARDRLVAAVIGLLFILFSVTILRFIGVNLLQIPGFAS